MKTSQTIAVIGAALLMFAGASAQAQVITWGAVQTISTDTDVSTAGTLLYADYVAVGNSGTDTVNGVTFNGSFSTPTQAGFTNFDAAQNYGGLYFPPVDGQNGYTGSAYYTALLSGVFYNSGGIVAGQTLTLTGLTSGQEYEFEAFGQDGRGGRNTFFTTLTAGNSASLQLSTTDNADQGVGQFVVGTFVATGSTEVIDISGTAIPTINAFQVRDIPAEVPEPSTYALMGLGALALLVVSRRRRTA